MTQRIVLAAAKSSIRPRKIYGIECELSVFEGTQ
jgi:hypothetical protein